MFSAMSWREQDTFDNNDVCFVLVQSEVVMIYYVGSNKSLQVQILMTGHFPGLAQ
jgi:hypothetical protein